jgi:hypothetical protein
MGPRRHSIPIGIVGIALAGLWSTGCGSRGLRSARTDGGASDAAAGPGGQAGSTFSQGGSGGNSGGAEPGSTAGATGAGGSAGSLSNPGGVEAGGSAGADAAGDVSRPDASGAVTDSSVASDVKVPCGPVCLMYCYYGNLLDENGCEICACNSPPPCPGMKCASCPYGYVHDVNGCLTCTCLPDPSVPCSQILDGIQCGTRGNCAWLEPGYCVSPPPVVRGCYDLAEINCSMEKDCSDGRTCVTRVTKPCTVGCDICGYPVDICL